MTQSSRKRRDTAFQERQHTQRNREVGMELRDPAYCPVIGQEREESPSGRPARGATRPTTRTLDGYGRYWNESHTGVESRYFGANGERTLRVRELSGSDRTSEFNIKVRQFNGEGDKRRSWKRYRLSVAGIHESSRAVTRDDPIHILILDEASLRRSGVIRNESRAADNAWTFILSSTTDKD